LLFSLLLWGIGRWRRRRIFGGGGGGCCSRVALLAAASSLFGFGLSHLLELRETIPNHQQSPSWRTNEGEQEYLLLGRGNLLGLLLLFIHGGLLYLLILG
jgi:hypothetical protein